MRKISKFGFISLLALNVTVLPNLAAANSLTRASQASASALSHIVDGSVKILRGSGTILQGGSELVVASATVVGESVVVVLKTASGGAEVVLEATGEGLQTLSRLMGHSLQAITTSAGTILAEGSKVVLFVPTQTAGNLFEASNFVGDK